MSPVSRENPNTFRFSSIREGVTLFGITALPGNRGYELLQSMYNILPEDVLYRLRDREGKWIMYLES